jgi:fructose-1-phosphate kinase PfkB-like protein
LRLAFASQTAGAQVILMTAGEPLAQALKAPPEMVVLTCLGAESLFNYPVRTEADMISAAYKLREQGVSTVLIAADDHSRVALVVAGQTWFADLSETGPGTDSGVVDALLAGYLAGLAQGLLVDGALQLAAASMNYTDSQIGNEFGAVEQVQQFQHRVLVRAVEPNDSPSPA